MRHLDLTLPTAAANVAMDEALVVDAERGGPPATLRLWEMATRAVVLGASGRVGDDVDLAACRADGVELARRSSGGGTVLIGPGVLCLTVVLPIDSNLALRAVDTAQAFVLGRVAESIRASGPDVRVLGSGDLAIDGRKVSGSAQRRLKAHVLVHASLLYGLDLDAVARYLHPPKKEPTYRAGRSHGDFLARVPMTRAAIVEAIRSAWPETAPDRNPPTELSERLLIERFGREDWVGRL